MRTLSITLLCLLIISCGFQLRGPIAVPENMQVIAITPDDPYRPLQRTVREELELSGVTVTNDLSQNPVILKLQPESVTRSTYAVDTAGDVAQELLTYVLTFEVLDSNHQVLIPTQIIKTERMLYIHSDQLLSVDREQRTLTNEMRQEAVQQLLRRIAAYTP